MSFEEEFPNTYNDLDYEIIELPPKEIYNEFIRCIEYNCIEKQRVREAIEKVVKHHAKHNEAIGIIYAAVCADLNKELGL